MNETIDAILRRITIFIGATLGTFVMYIAVSEVYGLIAGTPTPDALSIDVAKVLGRVVVSLTAGHAVALGVLAFVMRGYSVPALIRSAASGVACATVLEAAYLWNDVSAALSQYRIVQIGVGMIVSLLICAARAPRRQEGFPPVLGELT